MHLTGFITGVLSGLVKTLTALIGALVFTIANRLLGLEWVSQLVQ
jgi:zinc transporter ZupT